MIKQMTVVFLLILTLYSGYKLLFPDKNDLSAENVIVPPGEEKKYAEIVEKIKKENTPKVVINKKKDLVVKKEKKYKILKEKPKEILFKVKEKDIEGDTLYLSFYLYNKTTESLKKDLKVVCNAFYKDKAVDIFSWHKELFLKSKKTYLLKHVDLGNLTVNKFDSIKCELKY